MTNKAGEEEQYSRFLRELTEWNKRFNLTSITDPEESRIKHIEDSLSVSKAYDLSKGNPSVIDIGSGAGLPGIPLKIAYPNIRLTLVDSVKKKTDFMRHAADILGLDDVTVLWGRAEDLASSKNAGAGMREAYDMAVTRALAALPVAAELCLPFVKNGGIFISMKSGAADGEIDSSAAAIEILGGKVSDVVEVAIGEGSALGAMRRRLVVISKINDTPEKYPRKAGIPQKRPLK